ARTVRRSASTPRRWPSKRGSHRAAAQRPLPSMMTPTCSGAAPKARIAPALALTPCFSLIEPCPSAKTSTAPPDPPERPPCRILNRMISGRNTIPSRISSSPGKPAPRKPAQTLRDGTPYHIRRPETTARSVPENCSGSNLHDFLFLARERLIDLGDGGVGGLLNFVLVLFLV